MACRGLGPVERGRADGRAGRDPLPGAVGV